MPVPLRYRPILDATSHSIQYQAKFSRKQLKDLCHNKISAFEIGRHEIKESFPVKIYASLFYDSKSKMLSAAFREYRNFGDNCIGAKYSFSVKSAGFVSPFITAINYQPYKDVEICSKVDLFDSEKKFIVDDEFVIEMNGILFIESSETKNRIVEPEKSLTQILWSRNDKDFILSVGKENQAKTEIKVHKCVLGSRSTVFDAMINTDMKEKSESKVEIIEFEPTTVEAAIAFCYDQNISVFLESEANLFTDIGKH
uniref:BTB domain-containing protein n=1 Tax=Panagrolaimus sp. ES5 TaxID=591445 RepID=A0AC34F7K7_9BILA